jgi:hypothetical protein
MTYALAIIAILVLMGSYVADKRHVNVAPVTWLPVGGSLKTLTGVHGFRFSNNSENQKHSGDADHFYTFIVNTMQDPTITIRCRDLTFLYGLTVGQRGTLSATILAGKQLAAAAGGGFTLATATGAAFVQDFDFGADHRQYADGSFVVCGESADGVTSPFAVTAL